MLVGDKVNLRLLEREDLALFAEWNNDVGFAGEFEPFDQASLADVEKWYGNLRGSEQWFLIEMKDGVKVGQVMCVPSGPHFSVGFRVLPGMRNKGYCTEAVVLLVDYLFLSKNIVRVEAECNPKNVASQRVLEKAGFKKEGIVRKAVFIHGEWIDGIGYSILREEWREPKILGKA